VLVEVNGITNLKFSLPGFTKQVKQKVSDATSLLIQGLEEEVTYTFIVRSLTFDYGPASTANVTTGPQDGSPLSIRELSLTRTLASVELTWINGAFVKQPILGYYVESQRKGIHRLKLV
jgi:protein sidekick